MVGINCINPNSLLYEHVKDYVIRELGNDPQYQGKTMVQMEPIIQDKIAEVTDKINQPEFERWYGNGERDVLYHHPKIVDDTYFVNDKGAKITIKDLFNDKWWETRQGYEADLSSLDKIREFIKESEVAISKRISAFRNTKYAEKLTTLLDYLKSLDETDHLKALVAHYDYMVKTISDFELRFATYDRSTGVKGDRSKDQEYKNFLAQVHNFLGSFAKVQNLDSPIIGTEEERQVIANLKKLEERVTELTNRTNSEIEAVIRGRLEEFISNPEVRAGVVDFLAAQTDESKVQLLLDALGDSHVTFIAAIDKLFKKTMYDRDQEVKEMTREWDKFVQSFEGQFDAFLDRVLEKVDGQRTGRFIQKYSEEYHTKRYELKNKVDTLKAEGKEKTQEYMDALDAYYTWRKENTELKFKKEYYDKLNLLIPQARQLKEEIDLKKSVILNKGKDKLSLEDHEELRLLDDEMRWAKSRVYRDGTPKTGLDLAIANSLFKYSKETSKFYYTKGIKEKAFNKAKKEAEERDKVNPGYLEKWMAANTVEEFTQEFWDDFQDLMLEEFPTNDKVVAIQDEIKQLIIAYKNEEKELKPEELPSEVRARLEDLLTQKEIAKEEANENISPSQKYYRWQRLNSLVEFVTTGEYDRTFAEMSEKLKTGDITREQFDDWFYKNHLPDQYSDTMRPISIWIKMRPRNPEHIIRKPNYLWRITDIKPEYVNPNFKEDDNGYPVPTDAWLNPAYQALSDLDKENLEKIKETLLYLTEHTKDDIIKKGYIPAVPKEAGKKGDKADFVDAIITESDEIVKFIPIRYVERLGQQDLPKLGTGATEAENKEIEEKRKTIIEENRKAHGAAVRYDLAETMKAFIKTALNHKYKSSIEIDIKLFKEQMKRQKVKVTNARGSQMFDKIKNRLTGNVEEYEVSAIGSNMEKHFNEWIDGVFYEDFEKDEGWLSSGVNKLLDFTSLTTLGFNAFSGLNNKLIGNLQARIESAGGIHYDYSHYRQARKQYTLGVLSFIEDRKTDKASNITSALIKHFNVLVSQDELAMKPEGKIQTALHKARMLRDAAYFMQHIGEHQIQNTTLIALAHSHRIVNGRIINFNEFWESKKAQISFDKKMTLEERKAEMAKIEANYEMKKTMEEEFQNYPKFIDAYDLVDGYLKLKEGITLEKNEEFNFQQRVIGLNQRMHGIYNTEDAATIQRHALGRLAMQFRKWMRPMWNKRFGRRFGKKDWNERVRDYDEGMYVSTFKYIFGPTISNWKEFKKSQNKTAASVFKMILDSIKDTFTHAKLRWHVLSEVEKANVRKTATEFLFLVSVTILGFLLKHLKGEEDDDDDKKLLVLGLYQADRLFGELTTFTPFGIVRDGNRLFNSPAPVFSTLEEVFKLGTSLTLYPFRDEEERTFKTGIYHGEDKHLIYLKGLIPFVNQIQKWEYLGEHNQRYGFFR